MNTDYQRPSDVEGIKKKDEAPSSVSVYYYGDPITFEYGDEAVLEMSCKDAKAIWSSVKRHLEAGNLTKVSPLPSTFSGAPTLYGVSD